MERRCHWYPATLIFLHHHIFIVKYNGIMIDYFFTFKAKQDNNKSEERRNKCGLIWEVFS